jgi:hypothetical protein
MEDVVKTTTRSRRLGNLFTRMYGLGLISGSSHSYGGTDGESHTAYWSGKRPYILGLQRGQWACLIKRRHIAKPEERYGTMCGRCMPCPSCGETTWDHYCPERAS